MKIGVQTFCLFDGRTVDETFQLLRDAGFDAIDLSFSWKLRIQEIRGSQQTHQKTFFDLPLDELKAYYAPYRAAAEKYGVEIYQAHAPFPTYVGDPDTDAHLLEITQKVIELCGALNCPRLVIHPAFCGYKTVLSKKDEWPVNLQRYGELAPALARNGVTACLENVFKRDENHKIIGALCADPEEAARCVDELNARAGERLFAFCLDIGHINVTGQEVARTIRTLGDRITALHIHDNDAVADQHLAPYLGTIDWDVFCTEIQRIGYKGVLSFEPDGMYDRFPRELHGSVLRLLSDIGRLLARKIEAAESANCPQDAKK